VHFFHRIHQDPVIDHVKLLGESWDLGEDDYQISRFPSDWTE